MNDQPKALRVAERLEADEAAMLNPDGLTLRAARLLREQHAEIERAWEIITKLAPRKLDAMLAEREACARVCDEIGGRDSGSHAWDAAAAIRARGADVPDA